MPPKIIASRSTKEVSVWFEVRSRIAAKCQTKPINHVLIAIAPGMRIVAMGRKTSVVNAEKKLGIAAQGQGALHEGLSTSDSLGYP